MNRHLKLFLMFAPLALMLVGLVFLVDDMRHPAISRDQCLVMATGADVGASGTRGRSIYRQSENAANDVSLRCERMGTLLLNDVQLFQTEVKGGQAAGVTQKRYRFLPDRWAVSIHTGKTE